MAGPLETSPSRFPIHSPFAPEISTLGPALVLTASFFNPSVVVVVKVDPSSPAMSPPPHPTLTSPLADLLLLGALVVVVAMQDSSPSAPPPKSLISISPLLVTPLMVSSFNPLVVVAVQVVPSPVVLQVVISPPTSPLAPLAVTAVQQETFNSLLTVNSPPLVMAPTPSSSSPLAAAVVTAVPSPPMHPQKPPVLTLNSHLVPLLLTLETVVLAVAQAMSPVPSPEPSSPKAMAPLA